MSAEPSGSTTVADKLRQDRLILGVAGSIARRVGVDVIALRVTFVVLTVFGGAGLLLYLACWLLLPGARTDRSPVRRLLEPEGQRDWWLAVRAVLAVAAGVAVMAGLLSRDVVNFALLIVVVAVAAVLHQHLTGHPPVTAPANEPARGPAVTAVREPAHEPATPPAPVDAIPTDPIRTGVIPTDAVSTDAAPTGVTPTDTVHTDEVPGEVSTAAVVTHTVPTDTIWTDAAPSARAQRGGPPTGVSRVTRATVGAESASQVPEAPRRDTPRPRSVLRGFLAATVGPAVVLVLLGGVVAVGMLWWQPSPRTLLAVLLAVVGAAVLLGGFWGRFRLLIVFGVPMAVVLAFAGQGLLSGWGYGTPTWHPATAGAVRHEYLLSAGDAVLDLRDVDAAADLHTAVHVGAGKLLVLVPPDANVVVHGAMTAGMMRLFTSTHSGFDAKWTVLEPGSDDAGDHPPGGAPGAVRPRHGTLTLDVTVDFGQTEVRR